MLSCPHCSRINPAGAVFCYHDGALLPSGVAARAPGRFTTPLVFPSGRSCWSFDELAVACQDDWPAALGLLRTGVLESFLRGMGRSDLAIAAREAAHFPDVNRGLDQLLGEFPTSRAAAARLKVMPTDLDLGTLRLGQDQRLELHLANEGKGLLHGVISSDVPWLAVGDGEAASLRLFQCLDGTTVPIQVRGKALRADLRPLVGRLTVQSSGGTYTVVVRAQVPPVPFASGVLAGACSPRQLAQKARDNPREAAQLFETGAVARWYESNGWSYPVDGETVSGLAAVQQFFDALGLSKPARLELSQHTIQLEGRPGQALSTSVRLSTREPRPVYARAVSDQPWLVVLGVELAGTTATVRVGVPSVPAHPGENLDGTLTVVGNGRQKFLVAVRLTIQGSAPGTPRTSAGLPGWMASSTPAATPVPAPPTYTSTPPVVLELPEPVATAAPRFSSPVLVPVGTAPDRGFPPLPPPPPVRRRRTSLALWLLVPVVLLLFAGVGGLVLALTLPMGRARNQDQAEARAADPEPPPAQADVRGPKDREDTPEATASPPRRRPVAGHSDDDFRPRLPGGGESSPPVLLMPEITSREVEVVFCVDTTGSMGGLLDGAKQKIWSMCNQIAGGKPVPDIKVGLVAYKDRGDKYITEVFDLSRDLDAVHDKLHTLNADGGGDTPESVNQALDDGVNKMRWSTDKKTLRILFLVGDAPPHMDYSDDVKYPITCKKAVEKGIILNTIQCGNDVDCTRTWKDIASKGGGEYVAIPLSGGVVSVTTAFDGKLAELGIRLFETALIYGNAERKQQGERMLAAARGLHGPAAADRAAYAAKSKRLSPYDLLDAVKAKRVKLEEVKDDELPDRMRDLRTLDERRALLANAASRREELRKEMLALEKQRAEAIKADLARRGGGRDGFDTRVLELLRKQAKKFDIQY